MTSDYVFKILWLDKLITPENPEETNNKNNNKHQLPPQSKLVLYFKTLLFQANVQLQEGGERVRY